MNDPDAGLSVIERIRGKLRFIPAWAWLLLTLRGRTPRELWIGDSHAMSFNQAISNAMVMRGPEGSIVLRAGARLMHSLGRRGHPPHVLRPIALINRFGRGTYLPIFVAGEIDVRTQMVSRPDDDLSWVEAYVQRSVGLLREARAPRVWFLAPPPPADVQPAQAWVYATINGTVEQRLLQFDRLRTALRTAVEAQPRATYLDFTDLMTDETGALAANLTADGCHSTVAVARTIRARLHETGVLS
ncbi:hypothetical protein Back2_14120 [Nocardioides baekrokdamisoli]|uniref:SGNH hydrolase-type esterase domain-containing protein n=1 Tax=Nocardioides baekrokdamisoli TaxID=1804624 RepID=A0A3G9IM89_9ACTN|nr:hypothetical protein [Nocardioides baekrokdamisoli]BBH17125.1 hypothetical protein Back2_14120 [Nocardioides baekrokdamisoli]